MFFIWPLFRRYKIRANRIILITELIKHLKVDDEQKKLYYQTIDTLDNTQLELFYERLTSIIWIFEDKIAFNNFNSWKSLQGITPVENKEQYNILIDNI